MRVHGILTKWNDERGFGFIARDQRDEEFFVHISAFPRDGVRPQIGEPLSFEIVPARTDTATKSRLQAVAIQRASPLRDRRELQRKPHQAPRLKSSNWRTVALAIAIVAASIVAVGIWASGDFRVGRRAVSRPSPEAAPHRAAAVATDVTFVCDGRTHCTQMTSCAEATFFLQHCPNVQMDGDHDGVPCEQQWCSQ